MLCYYTLYFMCYVMKEGLLRLFSDSLVHHGDVLFSSLIMLILADPNLNADLYLMVTFLL